MRPAENIAEKKNLEDRITMKFQSVKGTRDFYPEAMRSRSWIIETWRRVSLRSGFQEYDSPIFEYLDLFTIKSGQEIAEQLFSFTDRGGRRLAIRPEITPSLGRMINAKINSLPRPIKWFSVPRLCRAENPQKGRLREFFQWNIDIIGSDEILADAECIFVAVDSLRQMGLTASDVCVRIGSRPVTTAALAAAGVPAERMDATLVVLDKRLRVDDKQFGELAKAAGLTDGQVSAVRRFQDCGDLDELKSIVPDANDDIEKLAELFELLRAMGVADYCRLDMRIVRGLAYYTGIVYEIFDTAGSLRAIGGGGRYDDLLEVLGGPRIGATGFGIGDVVLGILLEEKSKLPKLLETLDFFVIDGEDGSLEQVLGVVGALRSKGLAADFSYKRQPIGKQLKEANKRGASKAVIVRRGGVAVRDLTTGKQQDRPTEEFLRNP